MTQLIGPDGRPQAKLISFDDILKRIQITSPELYDSLFYFRGQLEYMNQIVECLCLEAPDKKLSFSFDTYERVLKSLCMIEVEASKEQNKIYVECKINEPSSPFKI